MNNNFNKNNDESNVEEATASSPEKTEIRLKKPYRVLAGIISICSIPALFAAIFLEESKPWGFLINGSILFFICSYVTIHGKVPKWLSFLNRKA